MLAYVFWHRKVPSISREDYEEALLKFHSSLKKSRLQGFIGSFITRISGAPWMGYGGSSYEDWYVLRGSEVLDRLNSAAVSGKRKTPHDEAARGATHIHGGLYELQKGDLGHMGDECSTWFSKPRGTSYEEFYSEISEYLANGSLWRRQMVLGQTTEFCLVSQDNPELPSRFRPINVKRVLIWSSSHH